MLVQAHLLHLPTHSPTLPPPVTDKDHHLDDLFVYMSAAGLAELEKDQQFILA